MSRRSGKAVLEFVDAVFADDSARDGLTSSPDPIRHEGARSEPARIELWPLVEPPDDPEPDPWDAPVDAPPRQGAGAILAARIAERIARWVHDGVSIPGTDRPVTPGDIMILVRRRNAFAEEMIRQLLERKISVAGADRMVLMDQIAIADLIALGRFALLPEDDLNLAALLKSPLANISEQDLYDLAQPREGTLWQELSARKEERHVFASAHAFLSRALADADYVSPFEFYARMLSVGMRKRLVARLGSEAADAIDEFLALALAHEGQHPPSLQSFLAWFETGASEVKRDMERAAGSVRVMTVHGAKGLEADVVIVPDTAQIPDHERRSGILFTEDCLFYGVPKALETSPVIAAKQAAQLREMREYRRLLYVALTRAREWLVLCGYENKTKTPTTSWYPHLERAAQRIGRPEEWDGEAIFAMGAQLTTGAPARVSPVHLARLPEFLSTFPHTEPAIRVVRPSDAAGAEEFVTSPIAGDGNDRFRRGLLIHALLSRLPDVTPDSRETVAFRYLRREGVPDAEAKPLLAETLAVLDDSRFAPLFAPNSRAEVAIAGGLPGAAAMRVSGQIDRLAVTADSVLVADFKTNRPPPASIEKTPRLYIAQMALYRAVLAQIYPGKRIDCALIWTDGPSIMALPQPLLDAEFARIVRQPAAQDTWA
jgi:ATP-dependent helicase/nuclease subunit A